MCVARIASEAFNPSCILEEEEKNKTYTFSEDFQLINTFFNRGCFPVAFLASMVKGLASFGRTIGGLLQLGHTGTYYSYS